MKRSLITLIFALALTGCNQNPEQTPENKDEQPVEATDTLPKVTGIGGIFFTSPHPQELKEWYRDHLGLSVDDFGAPFEFRNANRPDEVNYLNWDVFKDSTAYFDPSEKAFMINYRVQNLEALVQNLQNSGVTIVDEIARYDYGKFVHILDSDGNKIELWEPVDSVLSKMGRQTTK